MLTVGTTRPDHLRTPLGKGGQRRHDPSEKAKDNPVDVPQNEHIAGLSNVLSGGPPNAPNRPCRVRHHVTCHVAAVRSRRFHGGPFADKSGQIGRASWGRFNRGLLDFL